jgi:hypothetical protein
VHADSRIESPINQPSLEPVYQEKNSVARLGNLEMILGQHLLKCMNMSHIRRLEEDRENTGLIRLTSAVSLYIAGQSGKDYKLEITLGSSAGRAISNQLAEMKPIKDLQTILGECIFAGMETSNCRKEEGGEQMLVSTSAVHVSFPDGNDSSEDCKLEIMLAYEVGVAIWYNAF